MDFETPSINQIAEFFLYLFQERKLHPSTIVGYRTAIADKVGHYAVEISKDEIRSQGYPLLEPISCFTSTDQAPL